MRIERITTAIVFLFASAATVASEAPPLVERTEVRTLKSEANGVAYKLYVSLPHGYGQPGKTFPVVYLLDANYSFLIARNISDHLSDLILVGIGYDTPNDAFAWQSESYHRNRTRDYTPKFFPTGGYSPEMQKVSGGGPKFRAFIEKELVPFIDSNYATTSGDRTLVGHSYGGLFSAWNVITAQPLFSPLHHREPVALVCRPMDFLLRFARELRNVGPSTSPDSGASSTVRAPRE